ncbi:MAG: DegT/DnrJ/EryC1/StrS family aminotransferase [Chitinophagaceae bacterium]|nr:DegT/DnrJ/EryC1/StrS family aminotransferase [Chitinophagaceae bacterium]MEA3426284.1 DegT/DnrJ/EryC1/StrS family aminotransferase [Bacteroidota bacterium]MCA6453125.1 DegT/DnrJ/EryC1/StrS family aminotransferase [Chitinophagaceae bacterium]MCA6455290.1 DegT/DnrJ/EryC1/StrS family aminotransferase [Chitinophagaceae bacterium]MCA6457821.1 DegT/DnrJ/EryC1/StrS family aminotransferase [Chitinophagaceae bacterium]
MRPIQMVDTKTQYLKIKTEVDAAIQAVLDSAVYIGGKPVQDLAAALGQYVGVKHTIPCANGTDALQIAMMALDLQPGDEVITPSFTYIATTEVVALLKLKPVFVEVDPRTFCIDPAALRKAITPRTKAIVPVHLYGHAAPMEEIMSIAKEHGLYVIEDNAQAIGCDYRFADGRVAKTGSIGTIGATSFYPSKNLGAFGDGGAIFTNDDALAHKLKMIANHGQEKRYYHELVGCNSRLDAIQAAILNIKLTRLDEYNKARKQVAAFYNQAFTGNEKITTPFVASYSDHVYHQYTLILNDVDRDGLSAYLAEQKIPSMIYYPVPGHRQKMFGSLGLTPQNMETTDWLTERVISLPVHTEMDEEQLTYITGHVLKYVNQ